MAGWGVSNDTPIIYPTKLKELQGLKIIDKAICEKEFIFLNLPQKICANVPGKQFQSPCKVLLAVLFIKCSLLH